MLDRIKEPLQTLMSRDHYETAYAVLAHFLLLAQRAPSLFSQARPWGPCPCASQGTAASARGGLFHSGAVPPALSLAALGRDLARRCSGATHGA